MTTGVGVTIERENETMVCRCGDAQVIVATESAIGCLAVHPTISRGSARGPGYTVSHRASGFAIWHTREYAGALAVAHWLDEQNILPENAELVHIWKQNLSPRERASLIFKLSAIAPREWVVE